MGHSTTETQVVIAGDASGGPDSSSNKLRRAAVAIVSFAQLDPEVQIPSTSCGPLAGLRQVVARGEVKAFYMAIWCSSGYLTYITDYEPLFNICYSRQHLTPSGENGDIM